MIHSAQSTLVETRDRPWRAVPSRFAQLAWTENGHLSSEIIRAIRKTIPDYRAPGDGGALIVRGVTRALGQFAERVADHEAPAATSAQVYRVMGRGEWEMGRSLDSLQAAYRLGARMTWRRYAPIARRAGLPEITITGLADAIFAQVDEMAAESVAGYRLAQSESGAGPLRDRRRLMDMLIGAAGESQVSAAAHAANWPLPETVAAVVPRGEHGALSRLPSAVLARLDVADTFLLVPDPDSTEWIGQIAAVVGGSISIGPTVPILQAADSLRWARTIAARLRPGISPRVVSCEDQLSTLLLSADPGLVKLLAQRRLAPLAALTDTKRRRLESTLLAWFETSRGTAPEVAARVGLHPQTVRSHMRRLDELFGSAALLDPVTRFEIEVALRARMLDRDTTLGGAG